jgi:hypothetical protein
MNDRGITLGDVWRYNGQIKQVLIGRHWEQGLIRFEPGYIYIERRRYKLSEVKGFKRASLKRLCFTGSV